MDKDIEVVSIDNFDYVILMEINMDNQNYVVLSREDDPNIILVKKLTYENGNEYLEDISSDVEMRVKERFVNDFTSLK